MNIVFEPEKIKKGKKIADKYINKAKKYKGRYGYRENLGYDSANKVKDELFKLDMAYSDECKVIDYFYGQCNNI